MMPLDPEEVLAKIEGMKEGESPNIELWCVAKLIFHTGLEKKKICELTIESVFLGTDIANEIRIDSQKTIPLSDKAKEALLEYIQHLQQSTVTPLLSGTHLFPGYFGTSGLKRLDRHLEDYSLSFNLLREEGIKHLFAELVNDDVDRKIAKKKAATQFGKSPRSLEDRLRGITRGPGHKDDAPWIKIIRGVEDLTDYDIYAKNDVKKALRLWRELFGDHVGTRESFLNHLVFWVFYNKKKPQQIQDILDSQISREEKLNALEEKLLQYIEEKRKGLSKQDIRDLQKQKKRLAELTSGTSGKKAKSREFRFAFQKRSKKEIREWLKKERKRDKEKEKLMGEKIQMWRLAQGLDEKELARRIGVRKKTLIYWEKGYTMPTWDKLEKMKHLGFRPPR